MGQNSSKKAKEEAAKDESSTELEEEEDAENVGVGDRNVPTLKSPEEEGDGKEHKWWDQPAKKEKKRSRRARRNKRSRKANSRSRSSSKENRDKYWDKEEVIDVEDEDLVTGIRERQRWAWAEKGQGRREDNEDGEPEAGGQEVVEDGSQSNSKEHDDATQKKIQASDEQIKNRAASEKQFKGQIVANLSSKHQDKTVTSMPDLQEDPANRAIKEQSGDQAHIYNWPQASEQGSSGGNDLLEKSKKQQWEMDIRDRRERRKSYRKRIKFWTEENLLRRG